MEKWDIKMKTKNGLIDFISNIMYVVDLKSNLLSVDQLEEKSYVIIIQKGICQIYDFKREFFIGVPMTLNRIFSLKIKYVQPCLATELKDSN